LIHFKNFVNATMYLHPAQQLKKGDVQERAWGSPSLLHVKGGVCCLLLWGHVEEEQEGGWRPWEPDWRAVSSLMSYFLWSTTKSSVRWSHSVFGLYDLCVYVYIGFVKTYLWSELCIKIKKTWELRQLVLL
jgi:hypothetical protein